MMSDLNLHITGPRLNFLQFLIPASARPHRLVYNRPILVEEPHMHVDTTTIRNTWLHLGALRQSERHVATIRTQSAVGMNGREASFRVVGAHVPQVGSRDFGIVQDEGETRGVESLPVHITPIACVWVGFLEKDRKMLEGESAVELLANMVVVEDDAQFARDEREGRIPAHSPNLLDDLGGQGFELGFAGGVDVRRHDDRACGLRNVVRWLEFAFVERKLMEQG